MQSKLSSTNWGLYNVFLAITKILILILASAISRNVLVVAITILTLSALIIFSTGRVKQVRISRIDIVTLIKPELNRVTCFLVFWTVFYFDILISRFNFGDIDSANYSLVSNVAKSIFAITLLDLWGQIKKHRVKSKESSGYIKHLVIREIIKFIFLALILTIGGEKIYYVAFGENYKFLHSELIVLLLSNIFWSVSYALLAAFRFEFVYTIYVVLLMFIILIFYYIASFKLKLEYIYALSSVSLALLLAVIVLKKITAKPKDILYNKNAK